MREQDRFHSSCSRICYLILIVVVSMSGHICVGCREGEAQIREKRGHRLRFCGDVCQAAFYQQAATLQIGKGLMDTVSETPPESLRQELENTFRPFARPDLPLVLANAFAQARVTYDGKYGVNPKQIFAIYVEIFGKAGEDRPDFLGWDYEALYKAVFEHGLNQEFGSVAALLIKLAGPASADLWDVNLWGGDTAYDAQRVAYIFAKLATKPVDDRVAIARTLTQHPASLTRGFIHFSRQVMRLAVGADDVESVASGFKLNGLFASLTWSPKEVIAAAGEMGSRLVFGYAVERLQEQIASGKVNSETELTSALARTVARANNWT
jgi:hypothetical protein